MYQPFDSSVCWQGTVEEKLEMAFKVYDVDGDGILCFDELQDVSFSNCLEHPCSDIDG